MECGTLYAAGGGSNFYQLSEEVVNHICYEILREGQIV